MWKGRKQRYVGEYDTEEEARTARDEALLTIMKDEARARGDDRE